MALNFFKPPEYLTIPSVGIDISDSCIRFVQIGKTKGTFSLKNLGEISIPEGVISGGKISNQDILVSLLSSLKKKINSTFVKVSVPEEESYIFSTEIPNVSQKEMRSVVEFSLEEFVPLKSSEASFEFMPVRTLSNGKVEVSVSAVPKIVIESYIDTFKRAGLNIISFCNESRVVARALIKEGDQNSYMIVNIKDKNTILSIIEKGVVVFTSTVNVGTDTLADKINDVGLKTNKEGCFKIPESAFLNSSLNTSEYLYILANMFSVVRDEIIRFDEFWRSKDHAKPSKRKVMKIILSGRTSLVPGFSRYISSSLDAEVEVGNIWQNVFSLESEIPQIGFIDSLDFAAAVGISI